MICVKKFVKNDVVMCQEFILASCYQGNVGDSRGVVSVHGIAEPLSQDHKPGNEQENRRIVAAGGWVEFNRVNGKSELIMM